MTEEDTVHRRPLLAIPGWLLFGCLFLPTLRVCGDPTMPLEFPPSYAVYLGGLVLALLGGARLVKSRQRAFAVLLGLWTLTLFGIATAFTGAGGAVVALVFGSLLLGLQVIVMIRLLRVAWSDTAIAIGCFVHALIATGWSALMAFDPDGMWGAHVAMWAGVSILVASAIMIAQARAEAARLRFETEPAPLPQARAIVRD